MGDYKITFETWNKLASVYREKFMDFDLYDDTYDSFCNQIKEKGAKILEIGCGPGNITKYLLEKRPDFKIEAIDIAPNMIKLAKEINPNAEFKVMDCRDIDQLVAGYDAIICGFCVPYLSKDDCFKFIRDCASLLERRGILYFSAIEDEYSKSSYETSSDGQHTMFVYYHQADYLTNWLEDNCFEDIEVVRKEYITPNGTSIHMIITAKKT